MQDVCISFWKEDGSSDMMLKVTDICSTDPNDPTHCESPADIKVERSKVSVMEGLTANPLTSYPQLTGNEFPEKTWWFFMKCWADGLPQPAYQDNNWFTSPPLANNLKWAQDTATEQYKNNQVAYAAKGWPTYPNGAYDPKRDDTTSPPITDWVPGLEPKYQPIAGGKGWGNSPVGASVASQGTFGGAPISSAVSASPSVTAAAVAGDGPGPSVSVFALSPLVPASSSSGGAAAPTGSATPIPPNAGRIAPLGNESKFPYPPPSWRIFRFVHQYLPLRAMADLKNLQPHLPPALLTPFRSTPPPLMTETALAKRKRTFTTKRMETRHCVYDC